LSMLSVLIGRRNRHRTTPNGRYVVLNGHFFSFGAVSTLSRSANVQTTRPRDRVQLSWYYLRLGWVRSMRIGRLTRMFIVPLIRVGLDDI
jgi:hypothetical protein